MSEVKRRRRRIWPSEKVCGTCEFCIFKKRELKLNALDPQIAVCVVHGWPRPIEGLKKTCKDWSIAFEPWAELYGRQAAKQFR